VQAASGTPHRPAPVAAASKNDHAQNDAQRERAASSKSVEVRRYAGVQG
jgi:hypothetical protein